MTSLPAQIRDLRRKEGFARAAAGMEPAGRCWKPLSNWLGKQDGIEVAIANTYGFKPKRRSLTTTDETKCDRKDALTTARLAKDPASRRACPSRVAGLGYLELYMPRDTFAELKCLL